MFDIIEHEQNIIEVIIDGALTRDEFRDIVDRISGYCQHCSDSKIVFNTCTMKDTFLLKIYLEDFGFYSNFKNCVDRVAFVSRTDKERFMIQEFGPVKELEIKTFPARDNKGAYHWVKSGSTAQRVTIHS
jgi:hypothetical protein